MASVHIPAIERLLEEGNGTLLASAAAKAGVSRSALCTLVDQSFLERTDRGVYVRAGDIDDEMYALQQRARKIVYTHETALYLHRLTTRAPLRYAITVPQSYKPSATIRERCKVYYTQPERMDIGLARLETGFGHLVSAYDRERSICDAVRNRNRIDRQVFVEAMQAYPICPDANLHRLNEYAQRLGVAKLLRQYMEVLLG